MLYRIAWMKSNGKCKSKNFGHSFEKQAIEYFESMCLLDGTIRFVLMVQIEFSEISMKEIKILKLKEFECLAGKKSNI